jgi:hypothetical protein
MDAPPICREQISVAILDSKADITLGEGDVRLEDYLNDKIQTRPDLTNLAGLMENIELQKKQLEDQVGFHHRSEVLGLSWLIIRTASGCQSETGAVEAGHYQSPYPSPSASQGIRAAAK